MKKLILLTMILISLDAFAPAANTLTIVKTESINPFEHILNAVGLIETNNDHWAFNPIENAYGIYQIRPVRLNDFNSRTGKHYCRWDLFNLKVSREIFLYYAEKFGPYETDDMIRSWNGSGKATCDYLKRVKAIL
jgi:hypothetical protein